MKQWKQWHHVWNSFFPLFPSNCAEFFKARESNLPLWSGGRFPIGCWLSGLVWITLPLLQFIDKLPEPGAGNWGNKGKERKMKSIDERTWAGNIIYGKFTDWFLISVLYSLFFFHFKGNGSYSRSESLVGAAREVCLPDSPFINILSQHGASACAR